MGMYDSFFDSAGNEYQLKYGECCLNQFQIWDEVSNAGYDDGVYVLSYDDSKAVLVHEGKFYKVLSTEFLKMAAIVGVSGKTLVPIVLTVPNEAVFFPVLSGKLINNPEDISPI